MLWLVRNGVFLFDLIVLICGCLPVVFLWAFHSYLMCTGQTTWEVVSRERISYLKNRALDFYPFDEGCFRNMGRFLCQCTVQRWEAIYSKKSEKCSDT